MDIRGHLKVNDMGVNRPFANPDEMHEKIKNGTPSYLTDNLLSLST